LYNKRVKKIKQKKKNTPAPGDGNSIISDYWDDEDDESSSLSDLSDLDDDEEIDETKPPEGVT